MPWLPLPGSVGDLDSRELAAQPSQAHVFGGREDFETGLGGREASVNTQIPSMRWKGANGGWLSGCLVRIVAPELGVEAKSRRAKLVRKVKSFNTTQPRFLVRPTRQSARWLVGRRNQLNEGSVHYAERSIRSFSSATIGMVDSVSSVKPRYFLASSAKSM